METDKYINKSKIAQMPKINYFQCKSNKVNGYIFTKKNKSPIPIRENPIRRNLIINRTMSTNYLYSKNQHNKYITIQATNKIRQVNFQDDDCTIAEEFNENEQHIGSNLEKQEIEKLYKFPELSNTPKSNIQTNSNLEIDRKRSTSYMTGDKTCLLISRKKRPQNLVKVEKEEGDTTSGTKATTTEREIDTKNTSQKENIRFGHRFYGINSRSSTNLRSNLKKDIREKCNAVLNTGSHKFSNTAQAKPKVLTKREEQAGDISEMPGDELITIRINKKITIPY